MGMVLISFDRSAHQGALGRPAVDSLADERHKAIAIILDSLKGKEMMPADSVFSNLKVFKAAERVPVKHFMAIMDYWGEALGVNCSYCHSPANWASDGLKTKRIARNMYLMRQTINGQILSKINDIDPKAAQVNCGTCHHGNVIPPNN